MFPIAELPFLAERQVLGEIELQVWADEDRQHRPDQQVQRQDPGEHRARCLSDKPDRPVWPDVGRAHAFDLHSLIRERDHTDGGLRVADAIIALIAAKPACLTSYSSTRR